MINRILSIVSVSLVLVSSAFATPRQRISLDAGWKFKLGDAADPVKDFGFGAGGAQFAKAGGGGGVTTLEFDDFDWRQIDVPHDWVVELPFDQKGDNSHGSRTIGRSYPATTIGWYRKTFDLPQEDADKRISVEFDGVFRDCQVWLNGYYLGRHESGYSSFACDLSAVANYGGANVLVVRVDASQFEGWFYEGAGIYRHVWLLKTDPTHVDRYGTQITTDKIDDNGTAHVTIRTRIMNESDRPSNLSLATDLLDADGKTVATVDTNRIALDPWQDREIEQRITLPHASLWSCESPYLYRATSRIANEKELDSYATTFGVRTVRFDADQGFLLNGKRVILKGTCNHQDHAGVGSAIPDALQYWRVAKLKEMGSNALRTSHNPPTPELLDICDRMGMLVMDEHRLMGSDPEILDQLHRLILRDRNHPSVVIWSIGNEEGRIHASDTGVQIASTMQRLVHSLDPTRQCTYAMNGAWGQGVSNVIDVMGFNYKRQAGGVDRYREAHPKQPLICTEEASTLCTRGEYADNREKSFVTSYDQRYPGWGATAEDSWTYYVARPHIAGLFVWTGFDYRGEPNPYGWPAISSQFGIMDTCGFPKDNYYYYQAWWGDPAKPVLHLFPHWNWPGKEGQEIDVRCFSNLDEIELVLNGKTIGREKMPKNSHVGWKVKYEPGTLLARGYRDGKVVLEDKCETTGAPAGVKLWTDHDALAADDRDVAVVNIAVVDAQGRIVPVADNDIRFDVQGPGRIVGVGNGHPASHEPDQFVPTISSSQAMNWRTQIVEGDTENRPEVAEKFDDSSWRRVNLSIPRRGGGGGGGRGPGPIERPGQIAVYRGEIEMKEMPPVGASVVLGVGSINDQGWVYINGTLAGTTAAFERAGYQLDQNIDKLLHPGKNVIAVVIKGTNNPPLYRRGAMVRITTPPPPWHRKVFNGLAQVILRAGNDGSIRLVATGEGLKESTLDLKATAAKPN